MRGKIYDRHFSQRITEHMLFSNKVRNSFPETLKGVLPSHFGSLQDIWQAVPRDDYQLPAIVRRNINDAVTEIPMNLTCFPTGQAIDRVVWSIVLEGIRSHATSHSIQQIFKGPYTHYVRVYDDQVFPAANV